MNESKQKQPKTIKTKKNHTYVHLPCTHENKNKKQTNKGVIYKQAQQNLLPRNNSDTTNSPMKQWLAEPVINGDNN